MINYNDLIGLEYSEKMDCYALVVEAYKKHGINIPPVNISEKVCIDSCKEKPETSWKEIESPEHPCIIAFNPIGRSKALHVAFYIGGEKILHILENTYSMIDKLERYKRKVIGYYKYCL